jgi:epoxide hydrolase-like predicted phosphatase
MIRAVCFDLGGVILRTEYQAPREHLAARLNMEYEDLVKLVFNSPSGRKASVGEISDQQHWANVMRKLHLPDSEIGSVRDEFFAGDILDRELLDFTHSLRPHYKIGLISNAWSDLRDYIVRQGFDDAFDAIVISAEVGVVKPEARIYRVALEKLGVAPEEAVFLDDFFENVEGAQRVGMHAIHFREPDQALTELKQLLDGQ